MGGGKKRCIKHIFRDAGSSGILLLYKTTLSCQIPPDYSFSQHWVDGQTNACDFAVSTPFAGLLADRTSSACNCSTPSSGKDSPVCSFSGFKLCNIFCPAAWKSNNISGSSSIKDKNSQCSYLLSKLHRKNDLAQRPGSILSIHGTTSRPGSSIRISYFLPVGSGNPGFAQIPIPHHRMAVVSWCSCPCYRAGPDRLSKHG